MVRFIKCDDGSYLYVRNITRVFITTDVTDENAIIKASVIGPAMPFTVTKYPDKHQAELALVDLILRLEDY